MSWYFDTPTAGPKTEEITDIIPCDVWFNNATHEIRISLSISYPKYGDLVLTVTKPREEVFNNADNITECVKWNIEHALGRSVDHISWVE